MEESDKNMMYKLGRIESLTTSIDQKLDQHIMDIKAIILDHEKRLSSLEKSNVRTSTLAGVFGAAASIAVTFLMRFIHFSG